jgi:hypothetical protein
MMINRTLILLIVCFSSLAAAGAEEIKVPTDPSNFHLFLLAGQSNMAGRGKVEASDREIDSHLLTLDRKGNWVPAVDPIHFDKPGMAGVGLGTTFAREYAATYPGVVVGLIPCAVGGSPISSWEPGGYHDSTKTHPYDAALKRTRIAMKNGSLKGVLWHQGESDCKPELSAMYEEKLDQLISRLRSELATSDLLFIAGQMGQFKERPWNADKKRVNTVHVSLPDRVNFTGFVHSDELSHKGDKVHFDSKSYRELGRRYFTVYESILDRDRK